MVGDPSADFVIKRRSDAPPGFFAAEAAGLAWLAEAENDGGVAIARPGAVGETSIAIRRIREVAPTAAVAEDFGRRLAITHAAGAAGFGAPPEGWRGDAWIGRQVLPMGVHDRWGSFYAALRLSPFADAAHRIGNLSADGHLAVQRVCRRLQDGEFDDERPADRIHGDLWAGNLLFDAAGAVLIDPAAHGSRGETDLAMLALFGAPFLDRIEAAYAEAARLSPDWRDRIGLHQLHPLMVHAVTHGPSYGRAAERAARSYL